MLKNAAVGQSDPVDTVWLPNVSNWAVLWLSLTVRKLYL